MKKYLKECIQMSWALAVVLAVSGCGKTRPVNVGEADILSLGTGLGMALQPMVSRGDTVLLFGVPKPVGYTEELERSVVAGLESQLRSAGARVVRVRYTDEESERYGRGHFTVLHPDFAGDAWQRYSDSAPRIVISLVGWPDRQNVFLPENIAFVGISWSGPENPQRWLDAFEEVISVNATLNPVEGRPSRHALRRAEDVQRWFEERYEVRQGSRS